MRFPESKEQLLVLEQLVVLSCRLILVDDFHLVSRRFWTTRRWRKCLSWFWETRSIFHLLCPRRNSEWRLGLTTRLERTNLVLLLASVPLSCSCAVLFEQLATVKVGKAVITSMIKLFVCVCWSVRYRQHMFKIHHRFQMVRPVLVNAY